MTPIEISEVRICVQIWIVGSLCVSEAWKSAIMFCMAAVFLIARHVLK